MQQTVHCARLILRAGRVAGEKQCSVWTNQDRLRISWLYKAGCVAQVVVQIAARVQIVVFSLASVYAQTSVQRSKLDLLGDREYDALTLNLRGGIGFKVQPHQRHRVPSRRKVGHARAKWRRSPPGGNAPQLRRPLIRAVLQNWIARPFPITANQFDGGSLGQRNAPFASRHAEGMRRAVLTAAGA
jgi:hypothetical protein